MKTIKIPKFNDHELVEVKWLPTKTTNENGILNLILDEQTLLGINIPKGFLLEIPGDHIENNLKPTRYIDGKEINRAIKMLVIEQLRNGNYQTVVKDVENNN